jgi:hypothetical protein
LLGGGQTYKETAMRYLMILMLAGCSNMISPTDSPEKKAAYAACEENSPSGAAWFLGAGVAQAMQINDCMKAKGY